MTGEQYKASTIISQSDDVEPTKPPHTEYQPNRHTVELPITRNRAETEMQTNIRVAHH